MRTIKFRGKRLKNGERILGSLLQVSQKECYIVVYNDDGYIRYEVAPETVGQFTGLLDKNEKEIYEGDIVTITDGDDILVGHGVVEWLDNWGLWYVDGEGHANNGLFDINCSDYLEVIGNIHDNPELIEEY